MTDIRFETQIWENPLEKYIKFVEREGARIKHTLVPPEAHLPHDLEAFFTLGSNWAIIMIKQKMYGNVRK